MESKRGGKAYKMQLFQQGGKFYSKHVDQNHLTLFKVEVKKEEFAEGFC